jgi:hypothetical protein
MDRQYAARWWLIGLVLLTGLADLASFLLLKQWHVFEINPLFILSKSLLLVVGLKIALLLALSFIIYKGYGSRYGNFLVVLGSLYIILFQAAGAWSNCQVAIANPPASAALAPAKAVAVYMDAMIFSYVLPLVMGTLAYWVFDKAGYDTRQARTEVVVKILRQKESDKP